MSNFRQCKIVKTQNNKQNKTSQLQTSWCSMTQSKMRFQNPLIQLKKTPQMALSKTTMNRSVASISQTGSISSTCLTCVCSRATSSCSQYTTLMDLTLLNQLMPSTLSKSVFRWVLQLRTSCPHSTSLSLRTSNLDKLRKHKTLRRSLTSLLSLSNVLNGSMMAHLKTLLWSFMKTTMFSGNKSPTTRRESSWQMYSYLMIKMLWKLYQNTSPLLTTQSCLRTRTQSCSRSSLGDLYPSIISATL